MEDHNDDEMMMMMAMAMTMRMRMMATTKYLNTHLSY